MRQMIVLIVVGVRRQRWIAQGAEAVVADIELRGAAGDHPGGAAAAAGPCPWFTTPGALGLARAQPFAGVATSGQDTFQPLAYGFIAVAVGIAPQVIFIFIAGLGDVTGFLVGDADKLLRFGAMFVLRSGKDLAQQLNCLRIVALLHRGSRLVHRGSDRLNLGGRQLSGAPLFRPRRQDQWWSKVRLRGV